MEHGMANDPVDAETATLLRRLSMRYAEGMDRRAPDLVLSAFAEDAVLVVSPAPGSAMRPTRVVGHRAIASLPPALEAWASTVHDVRAATYTVVDGATAEGLVDCVAHHLTHTPEGTDDRVMHIRYRDRYQRVGDDWVITEREVDVLEDATGPFPGGAAPEDDGR